MTKKFINNFFFVVITKNLNWEILTKNLVTLKDEMRFRMKNFNIMEAQWKIWFLGRSQKIYRGRIA